MSISNYTDLVAALGNWLNRSDLSARIPEFITLAEARFRRTIDDLNQDTSAAIALTAGVGTLPTGMGHLASVADPAYGRLTEVSESQLSAYTNTSGSYPAVYAVVGSQIKTVPASTGTLNIVYRLDLPAVTASNATNWLLNRAPDIYLRGSLLEAEFFGWNDERLPLIKAALDESIAEMNRDSERRRWGSAPIAPRLGRS